MGPVGAGIYVLSCKPPVAREHAAFVNPLWKQAVDPRFAGDATRIIVAAAITMSMGLVMWHDIVAKYALGSAFGLLVFQSIFARDMLGGSYMKALRTSLYPEWISMNAVMAGMIRPMVILMSSDMASTHPTSPRFWGVMSLSTILGFFVAYPVNLRLGAVKLKHGMENLTRDAKGGPFDGNGCGNRCRDRSRSERRGASLHDPRTKVGDGRNHSGRLLGRAHHS